jgi:UDP-2,4-diacetamido-2,4,6-trideoxy-beta-L-altropyranose hydrolase
VDTVIIRADASPDIGAGHQMRCLALAQAIGKLGGRAVFAAAQTLPLVEQRVVGEGISFIHIKAAPGSVADAVETAAIANNFEAGWIVADGYCFDAEFQGRIKAAGLHLLIIDDVSGCRHYHGDVIVNQNVSAGSLDYAAREPYTDLCLGTHYALLRHDFLQPPRTVRPCPPHANKVLVTLGGGETSTAMETVVEALLQCAIADLRAVILLDAAHPALSTMQEKAEAFPGAIDFVTDSTRIAEHMRWAHMAVSAGGGTTWELAYFGVPMLLVVVAENQRPSTEELADRQAVVNLGHADELSVPITAKALESLCHDASRRQRMSEKLRGLVDGNGARRVAALVLRTELQETT